jgi:hypothetical protein
MKGTNWHHAPWNNRRLCPRCGAKAEIPVGGRKYCRACARGIELFLSSLQVREVAPGVVATVRP